MLSFLANRSINHRLDDYKNLTKQLFDTSKDLYKKDLTAHYGCVNAIEFSSDGNLLFSGGDDRRVLMWNVNNALMYYTGKLGDGAKPSIMRGCHYSNIFCLAVDDENKRVLSGSNDDQVIVHDYLTGNPVDYFLHDSPVFSLSLHPSNGNVFASAADNGKILVYDIRESNAEPTCLAKLRTPFHGVMFNPCEPTLVATANSKVGVHIWDLRRPKEILHECTDEHSMAVRWNQSGTNLLALRNLLPPILYDPFNPKKALEFDSDCYYNACTMKSCSFAGDHDEFVLSGSDDFNLYMWKIPDPWPESKWVGNAHLALTGHRSIVNQVRYNPSKQLIATSGVEKIIKIWSLFRLPYSEGDRDKSSPKRPRVLCSSRTCSRNQGFLSHDYSQESVDEDTRMIHFFDSLLRNELHENTPLPLSQSSCVDGKLYPVPNRKRDTKPYEKLIIKKKKHLSKVLMEKSDDSRPQCSLKQSQSPTLPCSKRYHFSIEENRLVSASEDESIDDSLDVAQTQEESSNADGNTSTSPVTNPHYSSSSSSSSSSSNYLDNHLDDVVDSPFNSDSPLSVEQSSDTVSSNSNKKLSFIKSDSDNSDKPTSSKNNSVNFKDSGINVSDSSDFDNDDSSVFKRKKINNNRCYRNSIKRKRTVVSSSDSSDGEPSSKRKEGVASTSKSYNSEEGTANGSEDSKVLNLENTSNVLNHDVDEKPSESNSNPDEKTEAAN